MSAAYRRKAPKLPVSRTAVYAKLNGIEPEVSAALLRHGRQPLSACIYEMKGTLPTWVEGVSGSDSGWQLLGRDRPSVSGTPSLCDSTMTGQKSGRARALQTRVKLTTFLKHSRGSKHKKHSLIVDRKHRHLSTQRLTLQQTKAP